MDTLAEFYFLFLLSLDEIIGIAKIEQLFLFLENLTRQISILLQY